MSSESEALPLRRVLGINILVMALLSQLMADSSVELTEQSSTSHSSLIPDWVCVCVRVLVHVKWEHLRAVSLVSAVLHAAFTCNL